MRGLHHVALRTPDVERLAHHYTSVCGLTLRERRPSGSLWLEVGSALLMIEPRGAGEPEVPPGTLDLLAFTLPEDTTLETTCQVLEAAGVPVEARTEYTVYFRDPDGRRNGLSLYRFDPP